MTQLLIILVIVVLIFGTKKLRNMGGDLGSAVKNFKQSVNAKDDAGEDAKVEEHSTGRVIDSETAEQDKEQQ